MRSRRQPVDRSAAGPSSGSSAAVLIPLGREQLLAGHLQDRGSIPTLLRRHSMAEANEIAIEQWMTASPIYTRRMQRLLGFAGDDVETIMKGLQLEVGFPHQFMDVGYELHDPRSGEFWLRRCGALADVVPMGEEMVRGMCHDEAIEAGRALFTRIGWITAERIRPRERRRAR